jgi:hypothetical protein
MPKICFHIRLRYKVIILGVTLQSQYLLGDTQLIWCNKLLAFRHCISALFVYFQTKPKDILFFSVFIYK